MSEAWKGALVHMKAALALLDESEAPAEIGAHLDLAISRFEEAISAQSRASLAAPKLRRANASANSDHS